MLEKYKSKRDFEKTPEPKKDEVDEKNIFVIQRHDASHLHYDFRIQIGRILKSWAIPKGMPKNFSDKRLAVETEDHPLSYVNFEGEIPEGNYGAGTVEIYDKGIFKNIRKISTKKSYEDGKIEIFLRGKKLNEKYALIKLKGNLRYPKGNNWLIMKMKN
ncbi:MAG: DNA polymerase ligase N-terminal domain-containing protein [Candidatus Pacearchaeota archaeon]